MSQPSSRNGDSDLQDQDRSLDRAEEAAIAGEVGLTDLDQLGQGIGVAQFLRSMGTGDLLIEGVEAPATGEQARPPSVDAPTRPVSASPPRSPTAPPSSAGHEEDASTLPPPRRSLREIDEDYNDDDDDDDEPSATAPAADHPVQPSPDKTQAPATGAQGATAAAKKGKKRGRKARAGPSRKPARGVKNAQKGTGNGVLKRARRGAASDRVRVEGTRRSRRKAGLGPEFGGI